MNAGDKFCVYTHSTGGHVFYVSSGRPRRPYQMGSHNLKWRDHVKKNGRPDITIHAWVDDRTEARQLEERLINELKPSCNSYRAFSAYDRLITPRVSLAMHAAMVAAANLEHGSINSVCTIALEQYLMALEPPLWANRRPS